MNRGSNQLRLQRALGVVALVAAALALLAVLASGSTASPRTGTDPVGTGSHFDRAVDHFRAAFHRKVHSGRRVMGVPRSKLDSIASCESGGNPSSVSAGGTYRGKYQFSFSAWESVGGSGDPAKAPEWEQDLRAARLYQASGSSPWPNCG